MAQAETQTDAGSPAPERGPGALARFLHRWFPRRESMAQARRLIIGLGNPGPEYEDTRHNVGFMVSDAVAERARVAFEPARGPYVLATGSWRGTPFGVAKTAALYMNQSGTAVRKLIGHHGLTAQDVLVVFDDIALEPGTIRLRAGGGAGGHNGVQDVIDKLGTPNFPRLRIGVGSAFPRGRQVDYVLSPFSAEQLPLIEEAIARAADAAMCFVRDGLNVAMNRFNQR